MQEMTWQVMGNDVIAIGNRHWSFIPVYKSLAVLVCIARMLLIATCHQLTQSTETVGGLFYDCSREYDDIPEQNPRDWR